MKATKFRNLLAVFLAASAILFFQLPSHAAVSPLYDWAAAPSITDPTNDPVDPPTLYAGQDIVSAWHAFDGTYHYFRIDLLNAPSATVPPGYANTYGLYIDSRVGGAPNSNEYIPGTLSGIDFIIGSELEIEHHSVLDWDPENKTWVVDEFKDNEDLKFQAVLNDGRTLEWMVKEGENFRFIGNSFTWWAGTMLPGDDDDGITKLTYDLTNSATVPIPAAAWLLGSGLIALVGLKRRRKG